MWYYRGARLAIVYAIQKVGGWGIAPHVIYLTKSIF